MRLRVALTYQLNQVNRVAAVTLSRGIVTGFRGATLILEQTREILVLVPEVTLRYTTVLITS